MESKVVLRELATALREPLKGSIVILCHIYNLALHTEGRKYKYISYHIISNIYIRVYIYIFGERKFKERERQIKRIEATVPVLFHQLLLKLKPKLKPPLSPVDSRTLLCCWQTLIERVSRFANRIAILRQCNVWQQVVSSCGNNTTIIATCVSVCFIKATI